MGARRTKRASGEVVTRYELRDPDGPRRWADWKRMGPAMQTGFGPGKGGCEDGAKKVHRLTLECARCGGLVDWSQAKRRAEKARRTTMRAGDGCASATCTRAKRVRPGRRNADMQTRMAEKLLADERVLVAWPRHVADTTYWQRPDAAMREAAARAMAAHGRTD